MDCIKVGKYILTKRKELSLTQKQFADTLNISDKTISKWERGLGCPDISVLPELAKALGVPVKDILLANISISQSLGGNMKNLKFYMCKECGNLVTSTKGLEISCCGKVLPQLKPQPVDFSHTLSLQPVEDELFITINHPMTKQHYISFVAYVTTDSIHTVKLYPEQNPELRFPKFRNGKFIIGCIGDGIFYQNA
jgi:transcriptional regulator with XRE-family HTH domain